MTNVKSNWTQAFEMALRQAAAQCRSDISELRWERLDIDRTWGDRVALGFYGASPEVCERAARFFHSWASKHLPALRSYEAQYSVDEVREMTRYGYDNGAKGWTSDASKLPTYSCTTLEYTQTGYAVPFVYCPGAE